MYHISATPNVCTGTQFMIFETLQSKTIYQGRIFNLRQDQVRLPDGKTTQLDIIDHPGAVVIIPVDASQIWFIRQYRHAAGEIILEIPAGLLEDTESPENCARREIREEIGMSASRIQKLGEFFLAPGYSSEYIYVYLASDLHPDPLPGDEDEFIRVEKIGIEQAIAMAEGGDIRDAKTLAAILLARPHLQ